MMPGKIGKLNLEDRSMVVVFEDGREIRVEVPEKATIEVIEHETMGTMGGTFEDLEEGYLVELDTGPHQEDGSCTCVSLVCLS